MLAKFMVCLSCFAAGLTMVGSLPKKAALPDGVNVDLDQGPKMGKENRFEIISREQLDSKVICITFRDKLTNKDWMVIYTSHLYSLGHVDPVENKE